MPQLPIPTLGVQSMLSPGDVAGGDGGRASREVTGAAGGAVADIGQAVRSFAAKQAADESQVAISNAYSRELQTSTQQAIDAANSGQMPGFTDRWGKSFDERTAETLKTIPKIGQAHFQAQMAGLRSQLFDKFYGQEQGARNLQLEQGASDGIESDANVAYIDRSQAADLLARRRASIAALNIPDANRARLIDKANQTIAYGAGANWAQQDPQGFLRSTGYGAADPAEAARSVQADPVLSQLKPENLMRLTQHAKALVDQQAAASARDRDAAEKLASEQVDKMRTMWENGQFPDLDQVAEFKRTTQGTLAQPLMDRYLTMAANAAGFGAQSLPRQSAIIAQADAAAASQGTNPEAQQVLDHYRKINTEQRQAYRDDPLAAGARFARLPAAPEQQIGSVDQAVQVIAQRMPHLVDYETAAGAPGVSPLHPQEAEQLGRTLRALPLDQQASALSQVGGLLGTQDRIGALAKQIGDKDGVLGAAMAFAGQRTQLGRDAAFYLLAGDQAFKDKTTQPDDSKVTGWRATIASQIRGAYPNTQLADAAIDAAVRITAGLEATGVASGDPDRAVRLATGGIIKHGDSGGKIPLPWGMTESQFETKLAAIKPADLSVQTHTPDFGPPNVPGMVSTGNIDLTTRPRVANADGSISTVRSISIGTDGGREVLIPTVSDEGKVLSNADAIALYRKTGRNLGVFDSPASATAYAQALHRDQEARYTRAPPEDVVFAGRSFMPVSKFIAGLPSATLEHAGQGRYVVRAGSSYVTNARGEPVVLKVSP